MAGIIRFAIAAGLGALMLAAPSRALCADDGASVAPRSALNRKAAARALFEEGLKLLEAEHWAAATDRFERARKLHASPRITYNLTSALIQTGRLVYATELLRELTSTAAVERGVQDAALQRLQALQGRLGSLTVVVEGDLTGIAVELNGRALDTALLDVPMPVDPGEHTVVARQEGETLVTRGISIHEGQKASLHLAIPARLVRVPPPSLTGSVPAAADPLALRDNVPQSSESGSSRTWMWAGAGAVVVAGAVVAGLLLLRKDTELIEGTAGTATLRGP